MQVDKRKILSPNSGFERQEEIIRLFNQKTVLSIEDLGVLKACRTESYETIGYIGCLLKEDSTINLARLLIASSHQYNRALSDRADEILNRSEHERNALIDTISDQVLNNKIEFTEYERKIYYFLFDVQNRLF
ncbi:MAG: hypothetical protein ACPGSD_02425 [Flavobacteriales bacterium]